MPPKGIEKSQKKLSKLGKLGKLGRLGRALEIYLKLTPKPLSYSKNYREEDLRRLNDLKSQDTTLDTLITISKSKILLINSNNANISKGDSSLLISRKNATKFQAILKNFLDEYENSSRQKNAIRSLLTSKLKAFAQNTPTLQVANSKNTVGLRSSNKRMNLRAANTNYLLAIMVSQSTRAIVYLGKEAYSPYQSGRSYQKSYMTLEVPKSTNESSEVVLGINFLKGAYSNYGFSNNFTQCRFSSKFLSFPKEPRWH